MAERPQGSTCRDITGNCTAVVMPPDLNAQDCKYPVADCLYTLRTHKQSVCVQIRASVIARCERLDIVGGAPQPRRGCHWTSLPALRCVAHGCLSQRLQLGDLGRSGPWIAHLGSPGACLQRASTPCLTLTEGATSTSPRTLRPEVPSLTFPPRFQSWLAGALRVPQYSVCALEVRVQSLPALAAPVAGDHQTGSPATDPPSPSTARPRFRSWATDLFFHRERAFLVHHRLPPLFLARDTRDTLSLWNRTRLSSASPALTPYRCTSRGRAADALPPTMNAEAIRSRIVGSLSADANVRRAAELELKAVGRILSSPRGVAAPPRGPRTACSTTGRKILGARVPSAEDRHKILSQIVWASYADRRLLTIGREPPWLHRCPRRDPQRRG